MPYQITSERLTTLFRPRKCRVSQRGNADQRERTCFRRHNRETDDYPRNVFRAEKIVLHCALRPPEERAEHGYAHQVEQQDCVIDE